METPIDERPDELVVDTRNEAGTSCADQTNGAFDALGVGASLLLVADHDPQPLYWMLRAERGESTFAWDLVESGPARWQARVTRSA
jgi:uncharacterized protein (DUF2249 family)